MAAMGFGYYKNISASDRDALVAYLRSLQSSDRKLSSIAEKLSRP